MKVIGLTGIFGSGKSTVAGFLRDMGATVIDADKIVHELYEPEAEGWRKVIELFGRNVLTEKGHIDRRRLAEAVFSDSASLKKLNNAIHPIVMRKVRSLLEECRRKRPVAAVVEAPLLFEAGWAGIMDEIWVTTAPREVIFRRLNKKSGMSPQEALTRIRRQLPVREQTKRATRVINTDTSLEHLRAKVQRLWRKVCAS